MNKKKDAPGARSTFHFAQDEKNHPFCTNLKCPCHEDEKNRMALYSFFMQGLLSEADMERFFEGRTI